MSLMGMDGQKITPINSGAVDMKREIAELECIVPEEQQPTGCRILLKVADVESISPGGIILEDSAVIKAIFGKTHATLVAASAASFVDPVTGDYFEDKPEIGDKVITTKYAGNAYRDADGNIYRFASDVDVVSVIKENK